MTTERPARGGRRILIIGIGAGNPEHITIQAINALKKIDVLFLTDKGEDKSDLLRVMSMLVWPALVSSMLPAAITPALKLVVPAEVIEARVWPLLTVIVGR